MNQISIINEWILEGFLVFAVVFVSVFFFICSRSLKKIVSDNNSEE